MIATRRTPRALGWLVAVAGALALVLGGFGAEVTTATGKTDDHGSRAQFEQDCKDGGGVFTDTGDGNLWCTYPDTGDQILCDKTGNDCYFIGEEHGGLTRPPDTHVPADGDGTLDDGSGGDAVPSVAPPGDHQPPATTRHSDGHSKKGKQHGHHGHHGKRHQ